MTTVLLAVAMSGCSLLVVKGPTKGEAPPRCSKSARGPVVVDVLLAVVGIAGVSAGASGDTGGEDEPTTGERAATAVFGGAILATAVTSAIVGYKRADECRQEWDAFIGAPVTRE